MSVREGVHRRDGKKERRDGMIIGDAGGKEEENRLSIA